MAVTLTSQAVKQLPPKIYLPREYVHLTMQQQNDILVTLVNALVLDLKAMEADYEARLTALEP